MHELKKRNDKNDYDYDEQQFIINYNNDHNLCLMHYLSKSCFKCWFLINRMGTVQFVLKHWIIMIIITL